jgi:outer membrane murein-binding lipoprotein Lpp
LLTRLNAIITLATPYTNSKYSDVSTAATTIVSGANALKATINNLVSSLNTAKDTASNASVLVS